VTEEHRQQSIQCYRHCKEGGARGVVVTGPNPPHQHARQKEVHMHMYKRRHMCRQGNEWLLEGP
jgi:hypothetical protein